jgi:outer membrane protein assembly factor BamB
MRRCLVVISFVLAISALAGCGSQENGSTILTTTTTTTATTTTTIQRLKWFYVTEPIYWSSPAIGDDGTIYIGCGVQNVTRGAFYALNPNGTLKWKYALGTQEAAKGGSAIGTSGTIYFIVVKKIATDNYAFLYALNPDGTLKWKYDDLTINQIETFGEWTPALSSEEVIYVPVQGALHAINPDGTLKWKYTGGYFSSPAVGSDGTIYSNGGDGVYAINPDGTLKWKYSGTGYGCSPPAIASDGTIYAGRGSFPSFTVPDPGDIYLYALNPDGTLKWKFNSGGLIVMSNPAIGSDGTIYVGTTAKGASESSTQGGIFFAINPDGTEKWRYDTSPDVLGPSDIYSSAAIGADGVIYFSSELRYFYAFYPNGTLKEKYDMYVLSPISHGSSTITYSSPAIASDGTIYAGDYYHFYDPSTGSSEGAVYALISSSEGLASTPWPRFHNNNKNTGRR